MAGAANAAAAHPSGGAASAAAAAHSAGAASARAAAAWGCVHAWDSLEHRSVLVRGAGARPATPAGAAWCSLACPAERVLGGRLR